MENSPEDTSNNSTTSPTTVQLSPDLLMQTMELLQEIKNIAIDLKSTSHTMQRQLLELKALSNGAYQGQPAQRSASVTSSHHLYQNDNDLPPPSVHHAHRVVRQTSRLDSPGLADGHVDTRSAFPASREVTTSINKNDDSSTILETTKDAPLTTASMPVNSQSTNDIAINNNKYTVAQLLECRPTPTEDDILPKWKEALVKFLRPPPSIRWTLSFPFASRYLIRGDSYMTPQLLKIDVQEKLVDGQWQIPRTVIICSTTLMVQHAEMKLKRCVSGSAARHPEIDFGEGLSVAVGNDQEILEASTPFIHKERPLIICTPKDAGDLLTADIDQVWWLNVKMPGMSDLLDGFQACVPKLSRSFEVTVIFGKEDHQPARYIKRWLADTGAEVLTPLTDVDRHFNRGWSSAL